MEWQQSEKWLLRSLWSDWTVREQKRQKRNKNGIGKVCPGIRGQAAWLYVELSASMASKKQSQALSPSFLDARVETREWWFLEGKLPRRTQGAASRCRRGVRSFCRRKQRVGRLPGPRRTERRPNTRRARCHYSPLLSYGPRRRPAGHSPCWGSPSPARRQGWAQPARGDGGAGVREPVPEMRPRRSWVQRRQPGALRSLAPPTSPPSTWRGEGRHWGGGPRPAARTFLGY